MPVRHRITQKTVDAMRALGLDAEQEDLLQKFIARFGLDAEIGEETEETEVSSPTTAKKADKS
jgi:hypothetical protein